MIGTDLEQAVLNESIDLMQDGVYKVTLEAINRHCENLNKLGWEGWNDLFNPDVQELNRLLIIHKF